MKKQDNSLFNNDNPQIRIAKKEYYKEVFKKIGVLGGSIFLALIILYLCFAATIIRAVPTNNIGFVPVRNVTAEGGISKVGDNILVSTTDKQGTGMLDHLKQSVMPSNNTAIVEVLSKPYGKINALPQNYVSIDDNVIRTPMAVKPTKQYLENEYVVKCVKGDCEKDKAFIVSMNNVYGEPLNKVGE